jgi:hypothetical protein
VHFEKLFQPVPSKEQLTESNEQNVPVFQEPCRVSLITHMRKTGLDGIKFKENDDGCLGWDRVLFLKARGESGVFYP